MVCVCGRPLLFVGDWLDAPRRWYALLGCERSFSVRLGFCRPSLVVVSDVAHGWWWPLSIERGGRGGVIVSVCRCPSSFAALDGGGWCRSWAFMPFLRGGKRLSFVSDVLWLLSVGEVVIG